MGNALDRKLLYLLQKISRISKGCLLSLQPKGMFCFSKQRKVAIRGQYVFNPPVAGSRNLQCSKAPVYTKLIFMNCSIGNTNYLVNINF